MPNLLLTKVASFSLPLIQSDEFANVRNWRTKEKENEVILFGLTRTYDRSYLRV